MTIESNRTLGGVGACLTLVGVVSIVLTIFQIGTSPSMMNFAILSISGIVSALSFIGFILFMVAMHGFSRDYSERKIFGYILRGLIIAIILAVGIGVIWFALFMVSILSSISTLNPIPSTTPEIDSFIAPYYAPLMATMSVILLVWVFYNYKAYNLLADKSGVHLFRTGAKIFVLGAVVNIAVAAVFAVLGLTGLIDYNTMLLVSVPGGLVMYVAWAFVAKGFFSIEAPPTTQTFTPSTVAPQTAQVKYCPNCGTQNQANFTYCIKCGQKLT